MEPIEAKFKIELRETTRQNLKSGGVRKKGSPDWSIFPRSLQPMDNPVISTNQKHMSGFSTDHNRHRLMGEESAKRHIKL